MNKKVDLIIISTVILLVTGGFAFIQWLSPDFVLKAFYLFLLITIFPVVYMGFRAPKPWKKILFGSVLLGVVLAAPTELIQLHNASWLVDSLVFHWLFLGILPIDNVIGGYFFMTLLTLTFYEHFFGKKDDQNIIPKRFYKESLIIFAVAIIIFIAYWVNPNIFSIPYGYAIIGSIAALVTIFSLSRHTDLIYPAIKISFFFFFVWFATELSALYTNGWSFNGQYLGWVEVLGLGFPFEELVFWMCWYAPFLIVAYEHIMRNKKTPLR